MKDVRFLTNTHVSEQSETLRSLYTGHDGKRDLYIGKPKAIPMVTYSQPELIKQGMVGVYERGRCDCRLCMNDSNDQTR